MARSCLHYPQSGSNRWPAPKYLEKHRSFALIPALEIEQEPEFLPEMEFCTKNALAASDRSQLQPFGLQINAKKAQ